MSLRIRLSFYKNWSERAGGAAQPLARRGGDGSDGGCGGVGAWGRGGGSAGPSCSRWRPSRRVLCRCRSMRTGWATNGRRSSSSNGCGRPERPAAVLACDAEPLLPGQVLQPRRRTRHEPAPRWPHASSGPGRVLPATSTPGSRPQTSNPACGSAPAPAPTQRSLPPNTGPLATNASIFFCPGIVSKGWRPTRKARRASDGS